MVLIVKHITLALSGKACTRLRTLTTHILKRTPDLLVLEDICLQIKHIGIDDLGFLFRVSRERRSFKLRGLLGFQTRHHLI